MRITSENTIGSRIKKMRLNLFPDRGGLAKCAEKFGVHHQQWRDWEAGKQVPRDEYQIKLAAFFGIKLDELRGEPNFNQKPGISFDKGGADDLAYREKRDMTDSDGVEFLKDHLATLKKDKADLLARVVVLEKELAELREENKRLLTLSSARDTRQAGSG